MRFLAIPLLSVLPTLAYAQMPSEPPAFGQPSRPTFRPAHEGFTFALSLGFGGAFVSGGTRGAGLGGLDAMFGYSVLHDLVLGARVDLFNGSLGSFMALTAVAQYWLKEDFTLLGGVGFGTGNKIPETGAGLIVGATWNAWRPAPQHAIGVYFELNPILTNPTVIMLQGGVQWQYY